MKIRVTLASLLVLFCLAITALPATADSTVYSNGGPITFDSYSINTQNVTSDTVSASGSFTPTDLSFYVVTSFTQPLRSVNWSFTSGEFTGIGYNSGTAAIPTNLPCVNQGSLSECLVTLNISSPLNLEQPADSWLNLTGVGGDAGWAISGGPSEASTCMLVGGVCGPTLFNIASEAFTVSGIPSSTTPEPSSILLLGSGILGFAGVLRRRMLNR
jgi:hypothetical protein